MERGAQIIDINMGCPAKKVCRKLSGSALLQDEPLVADILARVVASVDVPVTLKTRLGWDSDNRNILTIAAIAEDAGIAAIAIHGRTRACRYGGNARFDQIAQVASRLSIPVFANGDIDSAQRAQKILDDTGADGVLIGRATQGRPWILREISTFLSHGHTPAALSKIKSHAIIRDHLDALHAFYGDHKGVLMARKHLNWYCREFGIAEKIRRELLSLRDAGLQRELAHRVFDGVAGNDSLAA